ncbi:MAG: methyltransferase domain-containing protein [Candidatus Nitrosoglobus sp.]
MHNIKFNFGDMHAIPQKDKSIDTIFSRHCLEHSPMPLSEFSLYAKG